MATSKLKLYQGACLILKETPIDTVSDDILIRYTLDLVYDDTVEYLLGEGNWDFAMRPVMIDHSTSVQPSFGYSFAFEKPDDWVKTSRIAANEMFWPPLGPNEFVDETTNWSANCDPLYVSYISHDASFGLNLGNWPATFARAVEYELAFRVGPRCCGLSGDQLDALEKRKFRVLKDARSKDAMNDASLRPPPGRLTQSRVSWNTSRWNCR
jgi:hypothetical protein